MSDRIDFTIDRDEGEAIYSPVCTFCRHLRGFRRCDAFPDRIPRVIWEGDDPHTEPFPGDHGIRFEPLDNASDGT
jgi:hypothetical protein